MGKIVLLDDSTINKIAAGEVIERPASVVKEIMENSIDAGANKITVEIRNGGISYIRVTDNGKGIMQDDMEIAFERHATSKLRSAEDLDEIKSMGFRGEALASIAAIAKVDLISKTADSDNGYEVVIEGGKILSKGEAGCPNGTSITIENLFYNTPVRYKFLKKDFTESGYIEDVVTRIALVHPEISIKLINTGKTVIQTSGNGDIKAVIYNIYGKEIADNLINVDYKYDDIIVSGVVGKPVISRSNRTNQLFFVNKRYVKDKTLSGAAEQAFKGFITIGKHGFLVLNINMDPKKVDVNVHPAKLEVRFQEETKIFKAIYHSIREGLLKEDLVADTSSIDAIDKEKGRYNQNIINTNMQTATTNTDFQTSEKTSFRDIISNNENLQNSDCQNDRNMEEQKTEEAFEQVMAKLKKMQNMINVVKEDSTEQNIEQRITDIQEKDGTNQVQGTESILETTNTEIKEDTNQTINNIENDKVIKNTEKNDLGENLAGNNEKNNSDENVGENTEEGNSEANETNVKNEIENLKQEIANEIPKVKNIQTDPEFLEMYEKTFGIAIKKPEEKEDSKINVSEEFKPITKNDNISVFEDKAKYSTKPCYKLIGIAFNTYIIIEMKEDLYIIDQHAAHERIMYEKIKKNYYNNEVKDSQLMLLPDIITLSHKEMGIYKDNREMFKKAGFIVDEFGENTVKLSGVPDVLIDLETKELFLETLDEINTVARTAKQEIEEKFIATVACKAAVKAHMALTKEEVTELLDRLLILPNPFTCPHGRPTAIKMTKNDIEKKFSRR